MVHTSPVTFSKSKSLLQPLSSRVPMTDQAFGFGFGSGVSPASGATDLITVAVAFSGSRMRS